MAHYPVHFDLRFKALYGFGLGDLWAGRVTLLEVVSALMLVPHGDPLWRILGGPRALSETDLSRIELSFMLAGLQYQNTDGKGKKPEPEKPPPIEVIDRRKRAAHRSKMRSRSTRRNSLSKSQVLEYYQKQAEVDKHGKQHTHLQGVRRSHPDG